jgi:hypothetical protein
MLSNRIPTTDLAKAQKAVLIKTFNNLPLNIKQSSHDTDKFQMSLKKFLPAGSFYSCNEYFEWNLRSDLGTY